MSQLHHDPVLDEAAVPAPGSGTPLDGLPEAPTRRSDAARAEVPSTLPMQSAGETARRETDEASGSSARSVAVRRVRPDDAATPQDAHLAGAGDLAELSGAAEQTARAGIDAVAPLAAVPSVDADVPSDGAPLAGAPLAEDAGSPEARASDEAAERGRHRSTLTRRRPALYVAAALVAAAGFGVLPGGETEAHAEPAQPVQESVSVARALGIEGAQPAPVELDAMHLAELAASRQSRDFERFAAAVAQNEADALTWLAIEEAARPDAVLPVQGARLTSGFGARWGTLHGGIDLAAPMHTPEYAVMDGVVLEAGPASGFGLVVYIQHHNGDVTVYGHMDRILVQPGQVVRVGDTIALLGNRGQSTGPHLHFEVHVGGLGGAKVDPIPWLRARGVQI